MRAVGLVLLVRHGQASFGADDYDVLSDAGWEQARQLGAWLSEREIVPDVVHRGALRRHRETTEALLEGGTWPGLSADDVVADAGWDEIDHMALAAGIRLPEVHTPADFQLAFEEWSMRWADGEAGIHEESYGDFVGRVRSSFENAVAQAGPGRTVLVVSSGGPIAAVSSILVDPDADPRHRARSWARLTTAFVNTGLTRVIAGDTAGPRLLTLNEHSHLEADGVTYR